MRETKPCYAWELWTLHAHPLKIPNTALALRSTRACLSARPQNMLRSRRGQEPLGVAPSCAGVVSSPACPKSDPQPISGGSCGGVSGGGGSGGGEKGRGRPVGDGGELDPTIARLVRKLATKKWVVLYDSLKATFTLQAEGIAREVVFEAMAAAADAAARDALGEGEGEGEGKGGERGVHERRRAAAAELEGLRGCVAAWEAFKDWCEEVRVTHLPAFDASRAVLYNCLGLDYFCIAGRASLGVAHAVRVTVLVCAIATGGRIEYPGDDDAKVDVPAGDGMNDKTLECRVRKFQIPLLCTRTVCQCAFFVNILPAIFSRSCPGRHVLRAAEPADFGGKVPDGRGWVRPGRQHALHPRHRAPQLQAFLRPKRAGTPPRPSQLNWLPATL